jgi:hypothetical protein
MGWVFGMICAVFGWFWPRTMVIYGLSFIGAQGFVSGFGCLTEQYPMPTDVNQPGWIWWVNYGAVLILTSAGIITQYFIRKRIRIKAVDKTLTLDLGQTDISCGSEINNAKREVKEI